MRQSKNKKSKRKDIHELTKGFEKFMEEQELNPKHKKDFERTAAGKRIKPAC